MLASPIVDLEIRISPAVNQALRLLKVLESKMISTWFALGAVLLISRTPEISTKGFLVLVAAR